MRPFSPGKLAAAYAIDIAIGDPPTLPHPVRFIGALIAASEQRCRPGNGVRADAVNGAALTVLAVGLSWAAGWISRLQPTAEVLLAGTTLATGSLLAESGIVIEALQSRDLENSRRLLSRIVGRDTADLNESEIARAVIETLAESLCDGVIAPLLYLAVGGVPLAMAYKAVNTLDSMIGHPEHPYTHFGQFAARIDDAANFIPARLSALAIAAAACHCSTQRRALRTWFADGHKHPSPNAGQSEAAMAGAVGVRLGGTSHYAGKRSNKPRLGAGFRVPDAADAEKALRLTCGASLIAFAAALIFASRLRG